MAQAHPYAKVRHESEITKMTLQTPFAFLHSSSLHASDRVSRLRGLLFTSVSRVTDEVEVEAVEDDISSAS